jgi:SAM-dependent methyltransferase
MQIDRLVYSKALAAVRGSDFAHPGEAESIENLLKFFPDSKTINILDYGCGLGGTLNYIREKGYRNIFGIDIDDGSIKYAREKYGKAETFYTALSPEFAAVHHSFDLIYSINVFYLIADKTALLEQLYKISQKGAVLIISDFVYKVDKEYIARDTVLRKILEFIPRAVHFDECPELKDNSWSLKKVIDISNDYARWYTNFVEMIRNRKSKVLEVANVDYHNYMLDKYQFLLEQIQKGNVGGATILLQKAE